MTERKNRLAIIASKGTLDMAYPPLILATTAVAMEMEAGIFFTFYGLNIIRKDRKNKLFVAPIGNPAMPMPMPNILGMLPGMTSMGTMIMKGMMKKANAPSINELLEICRESGVRMIGCQMTMDAFGLKKEALIDGIEVGGAATFLAYAAEASVSLFI
ncbi:MAG: DsrE/DsrF/DrsH-like family protein [Coprothermobacterota bacterium]|nr:DsrE/DsrF/DrsH-like family protein [Coprothermobacterota bacterium]